MAKSTLTGGPVRAYALASQALDAQVKAGSMGPLKPSGLGLTLAFDINIGTLRAWNTLNGGVGVSVDSTSITSTAAIDLAARDTATLKALAGLKAPVDRFFDTVMVMADDAAVRKIGRAHV